MDCGCAWKWWAKHNDCLKTNSCIKTVLHVYCIL
jgi:hypothetical protein